MHLPTLAWLISQLCHLVGKLTLFGSVESNGDKVGVTVKLSRVKLKISMCKSLGLTSFNLVLLNVIFKAYFNQIRNYWLWHSNPSLKSHL